MAPNPIMQEESELGDIEIICEACDEEDQLVDQPLYFCYACNFTFCERCWRTQLQHRKAKSNTSSVVHEKSNPWIARQVQNVLSPPSDEVSYAKLCAQDEHTSWFGIDRSDSHKDGPLVLKDSGRYAELMAQTKDDNLLRFSWTSDSDKNHNPNRDSRTPSLVSFVGQSGAGKSTLINLLVTFKGASGREGLPAPVVGMTGKDVPTSEDVHLYPDPATIYSTTPLLFADCEGLDGGEREPVGTRFRKARPHSQALRHYSQDSLDRPVYYSARELQWASDDPSRRTRNFAVANLYPRLLFSFSDTVVFVLKNPRVIEGVFERLIEWAAAALESSSNQPVLPAAVIALNATEINVDSEMWDVELSTKKLLDSLAFTVRENVVFKKFVDFWAQRQKKIDTLEQLILCYFSSVQIVRIPAAGRPQLIQTQIEKLYDAIERGCNRARERKMSLRMLLNAGEMQSYLQFAFDHFARTLEDAFDFVQASLHNSPIPLDFGGNILRLALNIKEHKMTVTRKRIDPRDLFQELAGMVASCIMLDSVRHDIRGNAERIFPEYVDHLDTALQGFCNHHLECDFTISVAEYAQHQQHMHVMAFQRNLHVLNQRARCVNVRSGHGSKGHQTRKGIVFAAGDYQHSFSYEDFKEEFHKLTFQRLEFLMSVLDDRIRQGGEDVISANSIHREETLRSFYANISEENVTFTHSHSVCLGCLFERPEHTLPCGHMLCSVCVRSYGEAKNDLLVEIHSCPLEMNPPASRRPIAIYLKPSAASSRVLALDGGGIRSVIQLEVLRMLEEEWLGKLSIRYFFDLIIGSGTGGLIALGITTRSWSIKKCSVYLERIFNQAFHKKTGRDLPGVGKFLDSVSREKYDSEALENALREAFGADDPLFGALCSHEAPASTSAVAVAASNATGTPVLLASYNRRCPDPLPYEFRRPERPEQELKLWEAARATMSAPKLFKPFYHKASNHVYHSANAQHTNPIYMADSERRLLKQDLSFPEAPDLIVSIGAGVEDDNIEHTCDASSACTCATATKKQSRVSKGFRSSKKVQRRGSSPSRCQTTSDEFVHDFPSSATSHLRFVRFNPPCSEQLPPGDDLTSISDVQNMIRDQIDKNEVKALASKLIATLFYFEADTDALQQSDGQWVVSGSIRCRIPNDTSEMCTLGKLMRKRNLVYPRFIIMDEDRQTQVHSMTTEITAEMVLNSNFSMPPIQIVLPQKHSAVDIMLFLEGTDRNSISGFPRPLAKPETKANRQRSALADVRSMRSERASSIDKSSIRTPTSWSRNNSVHEPPSPEKSDELAPTSAMPISWASGPNGPSRRVPGDALSSISPTNTGSFIPSAAQLARSNPNARPSSEVTQGRRPSANKIAFTDNRSSAPELAQSPNFPQDGFAPFQSRNASYSMYPREQAALGGKPPGTMAGKLRATNLAPQDVARNVKLMSIQDKVEPLQSKLMFGEDLGYGTINDGPSGRHSSDSSNGRQDSIRTLDDTRRSEESVQDFGERLRQLESIIRSKERINVNDLRDGLKEEVLLGRRKGSRLAQAY